MAHEAYNSSGQSLEADSNDRDSTLGDNESIFTMSVTNSVYNYRYENGRRYHAYADWKYPVPNDEVEKDRLDLQHHTFRLTLDGALYRAPISKSVQNVLDIGCGTGIWAIEFAEEHPSAKVLGTDLSPIQPTDVPPNCSFLIDDADNEWLFREPFDFIHSRAMVAAFKNWPRFIEQSYTNLKAGGYLEIQDFYFPCYCTLPEVNPTNSPLMQWAELLISAGQKMGIDMLLPGQLAENLTAAGFTDIHSKHYKWPVGTWAKGKKNKLLGWFAKEDFMDWLPSSTIGMFTRVHGWTREEVEVFLAGVRRELKEHKERHFWANVVFWYARKPLDADTFRSREEPIRDEVMLEEDAASNKPAETKTTEAQGGSEDRESLDFKKTSLGDFSSTVEGGSTEYFEVVIKEANMPAVDQLASASKETFETAPEAKAEGRHESTASVVPAMSAEPDEVPAETSSSPVSATPRHRQS